jgi:putative tricarboxylic transport membrane protein
VTVDVIRVTRDLVFGAVCLALAAGYYAMAVAIPESALSDTVGAQGLPKTYAIVLAMLSSILIVRSIAGAGAEQSRATHRSPLLRVVGMLVIGILYLVAVPWLGYILALTGLIAATTYYQGGGLNARVAVVALSGALFFWVLFVAVLGIPHPPGIWPALF